MRWVEEHDHVNHAKDVQGIQPRTFDHIRWGGVAAKAVNVHLMNPMKGFHEQIFLLYAYVIIMGHPY